eukprot:CAMPEP_0182598004 /NCGR_PEP_ID=MMETSP1324-20130603/87397_1 /TAXON_ID=236786 /ORGANISM="Florenciella sp., Strain RCC1587" /LENGTH=135 /DNA_ID=CAMNT_0024815805 /DNA_START=250 /DNA_END=652 /DNA_ORIENTATION=+
MRSERDRALKVVWGTTIRYVPKEQGPSDLRKLFPPRLLLLLAPQLGASLPRLPHRSREAVPPTRDIGRDVHHAVCRRAHHPVGDARHGRVVTLSLTLTLSPRPTPTLTTTAVAATAGCADTANAAAKAAHTSATA